jgi:endonuclease/exonuclease/phosphatase family metal-dependent hydrolase
MARLSLSTECDRGGLCVLSYNVWGVFAAQRVKERMELISERLAAYDIVCLQEQFDIADAPTLFKANAHPYVHRTLSAVIGSGLTIASKYPILSNTFIPFRCGGYIERFWEGDAIANKGIAVSRVLVPRSKLQRSSSSAASVSSEAPPSPTGEDNVELIVFNTHLIAQYQKYSQIGGYTNERNAANRLAQMHQLAQLIVSVVTPGATPFLLCGDLNAGANSPELKLLQAYLALYGLAVADSVQEATFTDENMYNAAKAGTYLQLMRMTEDIPVQLDHLLFGVGGLALVEGTGVVAMKDKLKAKDGKAIQLSDHYGVEGRFVLVDAKDTSLTFRAPRASQLSTEHREALEFAASYLHRRSRSKQALVVQLSIASAVALLCAVFFVPRMVHGHYLASFCSFMSGVGCCGFLLLGQLNRQSTAISMTSAADDLSGLLTKGDGCTGAVHSKP